MNLTEDEKRYLIKLLEEDINDLTIILDSIVGPFFGTARELRNEIELANSLLAKVRDNV